MRITRANRAIGEEWKDHARCVGLDPNLFMVPDSYLKGSLVSRYEPAMSEARAVCASCPVGAECERDGIADVWSIRNGLTPRERGASAQKPARAPINHDTEGGYRTHLRCGEEPCGLCRAAAQRARDARKQRTA